MKIRSRFLALFLLGLCLAIAMLPPLGYAQANGTWDSGFDSFANGTVIATALQPDGRIIIGGNFSSVAGETRIHIARLLSNGNLDTSFNASIDGEVSCVAVQPDGKILIGGYFSFANGVARNRIARLNADGSLDTSFNPEANDKVDCISVQLDGKILVGGVFTAIGGAERRNFARLNEDGTLDASFNPDPNALVTCAAVQEDGKILIGGGFTTVGGVHRQFAARLESNGALDSSFAPTIDYTVYCLALYPNGMVLIGGNFLVVEGSQHRGVARLTPAGTIDNSFSPNINSAVACMALQADGKVLVGGPFSTVNGQNRNSVARLLVNGGIDLDFNPNPNGMVHSLAVQEDGKVLIGGQFTNIGGVNRSRIARFYTEEATQALTVTNPREVRWSRAGSSPQATTVTFEYSTNSGSTWNFYDTGTWTGSEWVGEGDLPTHGLIRARAYTRGGDRSGSMGIVEARQAFVFAPVPKATTDAADGIEPNSATVRATVNPNGYETEVWFEYGTTTAYGQSTEPQVLESAEIEDVGFSQVLTGLSGRQTYHYRVLARNAHGTMYGTDKVFTTPNSPPAAADDQYHLAGLDPQALPVLDNDSDADMSEVLTISEVTQGENGTVTTDGSTVTYTPGPFFRGNDSFTYTITDGHGGSATATVNTVNAAPVAQPDTVTVRRGPVTIDVLANDSDADGDTLQITQVGNALAGTLTTDGTRVIYTPTQYFKNSDSFSYIISDGRGEFAVGYVTVVLEGPVSDYVAARNAQIFGLPDGTNFARFGTPSMNGVGSVAFRATMKSLEDGVKEGVFAGMPPVLVARAGADAPGIEGGTFRAFKDPVLNEGGQTAFIGSVAGVPRQTETGIWSTKTWKLTLGLVARTGTEAPGVTGGMFARFHALALPNKGRVVFVASLAKGVGSVTERNDMGVWAEGEDGTLRLVMREYDKVFIGEKEHTVKTISVFGALNGSAGQRRGFNVDGELLLRLGFRDGGSALVRVTEGGLFEEVAVDGGTAAGLSGAQFSGFDLGALSGDGTALFRARLKHVKGEVFAHSDVAILAGKSSDDLRLVAREGNIVPNLPGALYGNLENPVGDGQGRIAFVGTLELGWGGVTRQDNVAIWVSEEDGKPSIVVRKGDAAPGVEGGKFAEFKSLAFPGERGVAFVATLDPKRGRVDGTNNTGLWAQDSSGNLQLLIREGQKIPVLGKERTLKNFTVLSAVSSSPSQGGSYSANGGFVYRATFGDGSQGVFTVWVP